MYKIYGAHGCPTCTNAKNLLNSEGIKYLYVDVREYPDQMPAGFKTVPVVYDSKGSLIGGYNDLLIYLSK